MTLFILLNTKDRKKRDYGCKYLKRLFKHFMNRIILSKSVMGSCKRQWMVTYVAIYVYQAFEVYNYKSKDRNVTESDTVSYF